MLVRTQVLFPEEMLAALRIEAISKKTSVSELVRNVVADKVMRKQIKKLTAYEAMEQMVKRAHDYKGPKAPKDLSTNDDYLYSLP